MRLGQLTTYTMGTRGDQGFSGEVVVIQHISIVGKNVEWKKMQDRSVSRGRRLPPPPPGSATGYSPCLPSPNDPK